MTLDINELQIIIDKLNDNVEKYNLDHLSYYNTLESSSLFWNDGKKDRIIREMEKQKADIDLFIDSIRSYIKTFELLINELSFLEGKISINFERMDDVTSSLNSITDDFKRIISIYERIDITDVLINKELNDFKKLYSTSLGLSVFIEKLYKNMTDINITIQTRLNNLNTPIVKEEELI